MSMNVLHVVPFQPFFVVWFFFVLSWWTSVLWIVGELAGKGAVTAAVHIGVGDTWHMTCDTWHVSCKTWPMTCHMWHITYHTWYVTGDRWDMNIKKKINCCYYPQKLSDLVFAVCKIRINCLVKQCQFVDEGSMLIALYKFTYNFCLLHSILSPHNWILSFFIKAFNFVRRGN